MHCLQHGILVLIETEINDQDERSNKVVESSKWDANKDCTRLIASPGITMGIQATDISHLFKLGIGGPPLQDVRTMSGVTRKALGQCHNIL